MESKEYKLSFTPLLSDLLYDSHTERFVRMVTGLNRTYNPHAGFLFKDILTQELIRCEIHMMDIVRNGEYKGGFMCGYEPRENSEAVYLRATGIIIKREIDKTLH